MFNLTGLSCSGNAGGSTFNGSLEFSYDAKDRLTKEKSSRFGGYTENNAWDGASNPTTFRNNSGRSYNDANQRTATGYAYDGNGNPTTYATYTCTYDSENRLTDFASGSTKFKYRADGLRASQEQSSFFSTEKRYYLYDQGNAVCELNTSGTVVATNVYAPDGLVGRSNGTTTWQYLFDVQGNVAHAMTSSTAVSMSAAYTAWGQRNYVYPYQAPSQWDDCFGYNARWGYVKDAMGLYYCQNRYYDPDNGRWLTRDPIGYAGGVNLYGYCGGGPVGAVDPNGLARVTWLYRLVDASGATYKFGVTYHPGSRYRNWWLKANKLELEEIAMYEDRAHALADERAITEIYGGLGNREPWSPYGRWATGATQIGMCDASDNEVGFLSDLGSTLKEIVELVDPTPAGLAIAFGRDILPALVDPLVQDAVRRRQAGFEWWTESEGEW